MVLSDLRSQIKIPCHPHRAGHNFLAYFYPNGYRQIMSTDQEILLKAANEARGLAIDAVAKCNSGHLGLPLGAAEMGAVLFGRSLSYHPGKPDWINRDRFVLSAGHGSMFLYGWLHLTGYDLPLEEIRNFRQLGSITPGHPEFGDTPGVEATTGPLGQGVGNAVGMAVASKMAEAMFNTKEHTVFDHHIFCLAGDGCLQEGVSSEAAAFAGHNGLDNLILLYDSNDVTLDAMGKETQSEDAPLRFKAYGFDVVTIDGHDMEAVFTEIEKAKKNDNGRPKFIECKTLIGKGLEAVAGTAKAHGEGGAKFADEGRKSLGLPEEKFFVSDEVREYFTKHGEALRTVHDDWAATFQAWEKANPELARTLDRALRKEIPATEALLKAIPPFDPEKAAATRASGGVALNHLAKEIPTLISGSADLHGSTKNYLDDLGDFTATNRGGRNIRFGIREHAMGAIQNGFAYHGIFLASGATFATFSDYMRPSVRLAALTHLKTFYIWTHDSVGVGEDGPTHQPVETTTALRAIPNLDVIRPADAEETAAAFVAAVSRNDGPTGLILTRQNVPALKEIPVEARRQGTLMGGYIARREEGKLEGILLASGSELAVALEAAEAIGEGIRVVSLPSFELFGRQPEDYRESVIPGSCRKRVAVEAGVSLAWYKYVGLDGAIVSIDRFGISAPGSTVMKELGITAEAVTTAYRALA